MIRITFSPVSDAEENQKIFSEISYQEDIEEQYIVTSLSKITDILCSVACLNHSFFLAFMQPYSSDKYFRCFLSELDAAGLSYEFLRREPLRLCGI